MTRNRHFPRPAETDPYVYLKSNMSQIKGLDFNLNPISHDDPLLNYRLISEKITIKDVFEFI